MQHSHRFDVKTDAQGRWRGILSAIGLDQKTLDGKHHECPICRGGPKSDSFRFDDRDGRGTFICSHCGAGDGVKLVMLMRGVDFKGALELIKPLAGHVTFEAPKAKVDTTPEAKAQMTALWRASRPLDGKDVASRYLKARGIVREAWPANLRVVDDLPYFEDGERGSYPCLLARYAAPDSKSALLHRTWLSHDGSNKAPVSTPRKFFRGEIPAGGAVRLSMVAETMGVAEGIETALSATALYQIPVWAACTAGALGKFQPPEGCKHLLIFADNDASFTGQLSAYSLARRLTSVPLERRLESIEVRLPLHHDRGTKDDWNDVLIRELGEAA